MDHIKGNCCCGAVQFAMSKNILSALNCHCTQCRKLTGAAFNSYVAVAFDEYQITKGAEWVATYEKSGTSIKKHFCKQCGTALYNVNPKYGPIKIVYMGTLEEGNAIVPMANIYCGNKLNWIENLFLMHNFDEGLPKQQ